MAVADPTPTLASLLRVRGLAATSPKARLGWRTVCATAYVGATALRGVLGRSGE